MRNVICLLVLALSGCAMQHIEGIGDVGYKTENYSIWHNIPVKEHPTTPIEWQAKANWECREMLMQWRLPDTNFGWKSPKEMTGCLYVWNEHECRCSGPPPIGIEQYSMLRGPTEIRFNIITKEGYASF